MPIHLIGAMLYAGHVEADDRTIAIPILSPLELRGNILEAYRRTGIVNTSLPPMTALVVLGGEYSGDFTINVTLVVPNADLQSWTLTKTWPPNSYFAERIFISADFTFDGSFNAMPVRILVNGKPMADLTIPFVMPD